MAESPRTYSIGEVAKLTDLKAHTLRYWETEFERLQPAKDELGNRVYTEADVAMVERIKYLLYDAKYTQEGARQVLAGRGADEGEATAAGADVDRETLWALRGFLVKLLHELGEEA